MPLRPYSAQNVIIKAMVNEEIKKMAEKIAKKYKPEKIILFGSYAWGKPGPNSDVDLFVVKKTGNTRMARKIGRLLFRASFP